MKQNLGIQHTVAIAFIAVVTIALAAFLTDFVGQVTISVGSNGIQILIKSHQP